MTDHRTSEKLQHAWLRFRGGWDVARGLWRDPVADRFEREFVAQWEATIGRALADVRALEETLAQAERESRLPDSW